MKPAELQKHNALKLINKMKSAAAPGRFGVQAANSDRRERRKMDQAAGLVPFAVKLKGELVSQVHALAQQRQEGINETVADLLEKALKEE